MKSKIAQFVILALVAMGAGPAGAALWQWSLTPANNGNADPTINWQVGMAPSAVDPSARAMMARMAEYRDDISGSLTTGGTSTAYTVTTNQSAGSVSICGVGTTPTNGQMIAITPNNVNGASATLAVDTCSAKAIQSSSGIAAPPGTLISGTPYNLKYSTANSAWMLANFYNPGGIIPLGAMLPYTGTTAPNSSFVLPAGQCLSTTTYANYWVFLGSPAPGGCGAGTFAIIDTRSQVLVALDNLNGSAANILTNAATGCGTAMTSMGAKCANGSQSHTLTTAELAAHAHSITDPGHTHGITIGTLGNPLAVFSGGGTNGFAGAAANATGNLFGGPGGVVITTGSTGITTTNNQGSGTAHPIVMPTTAVGYLLRVI